MNSEITDLLYEIYGLTCRSLTPVDGGWQNRLWRSSTDQGEFLVKQYSTRCYSRQGLDYIEAALERQILLEQAHIPCPHIRRPKKNIHGQPPGHQAPESAGQDTPPPEKGRIFHYQGDTPYVVMDFCPGHQESAHTVIDLDRNRYGFPWHDVGRALLSFALKDTPEGVPGILNIKKVRAFVAGYTRHLPLSMANVADALRISWCIEVLWWIMPSCFAMARSKATRYRDEILWLTDHSEIDFLPETAS